jgi:hypothetical protein
MKTAVELFIEQLEEKGDVWENLRSKRLEISIKVEDYFKLINQAKEMEKQQIINAWEDDRFPLDKDWVKKCADKYYNETYGGNK